MALPALLLVVDSDDDLLGLEYILVDWVVIIIDYYIWSLIGHRRSTSLENISYDWHSQNNETLDVGGSSLGLGLILGSKFFVNMITLTSHNQKIILSCISLGYFYA